MSRLRPPGGRHLLVLAGTGLLALTPAKTAHAQALSCSSNNPADWPRPARPYFMLAVDTSGSMSSTAPANSCKIANGYPSDYTNDRMGAARCAITKTVRAFAGQVNFGLATFAKEITVSGTGANPCGSLNFSSGACRVTELSGGSTGCGPGAGFNRRGGMLLVPLDVDRQNQAPSYPGAFGQILNYADNVCSDCKELFTNGNTPLNGILRDMYRYLSAGWNKPPKAMTATPYDYPTPLQEIELGCRSVNVILLTDGDETCDTDSQAIDAAAALWNGFTIGSNHWKVRVHVIDAANSTPSSANIQIANAGNGIVRAATSEAALSAAFAEIIGSAISPEVCNNVDDDCNGCVDEGYKHYCHRNKTPSTNPTNDSQCCNWSTTAQRDACIASYEASITTAKPEGDRYKLPCYTPTSTTQPLNDSSRWLCYDPGDRCDEQDNNCDGNTPATSQVDEGATKCGGHCPRAETCNGEDDNCDNIVDNASGSSTPYSIPGCTACTPSQEICDGFDNDCDGQIDEGVEPRPCEVPGQPGLVYDDVNPLSRCHKGTQPCNGSCTGYTGPVAETCNGLDDNCNGLIDDGVAPAACDVPGMPGLVYGGTSRCQRGTQPCNGQCAGWIGPDTEVCDGIDNDCDGLVDAADPDIVGIGLECDGICGDKGITSCVHGTIVCQAAGQPQPEVCDGLDNDCNGIIDDGLLQDTPSNPGCWDLPATSCTTVCSYQGASSTVTEWCAPDNASCNGVGALQAPCEVGSLLCQGGKWACINAVSPDAEVCDGVDNDCDGVEDNDIGTSACGTDIGECSAGTQVCTNGQYVCQGAVGPIEEICDGLDNDCDGVVDNGIAIGTPCTVSYDTTQYPGLRDQGQCRPGVSECDENGQVICKNGVGPQPEICDGIDNDCDGQVDEPGAAPDGINGTTNPENPSQKLGDACGSSEGACKPGVFACVNGKFECQGGVRPQPEVCDCLDNDCDGTVDEEPEPGSSDPPLCGEGKACVEYEGCQCAAPCKTGEFPCPTGGYVCQNVDISGTEPPESAGNRCVIDQCDDCPSKTVTGPAGIECGPAGTVNAQGQPVPVCECKSNGCHAPCYGVSCGANEVCTNFGANPGSCVADNCWHVPCPSGHACHNGECVTNPCKADSCESGEVCKPSADFASFTCVGSCATVECQPSQVCQNGECVETGCEQPCELGHVCAGSEAGCVPSKCDEDSCSNGAYCDPLTGNCGDDPCSGVLCPSGQQCKGGECVTADVPDAGADSGPSDGGPGGSGGSGGSDGGQVGDGSVGGSDGSSAAGAAGGSTTDEVTGDRNWGLVTGGGGCSCRTAPAGGQAGALAALAVGAALMMSRRRRRLEAENESDPNASNPHVGRDGGRR